MTDVAERPDLLLTDGFAVTIMPYADFFGRAFEASVAYGCVEAKQRGFVNIRQAWAWCEMQAPKVMASAS